MSKFNLMMGDCLERMKEIPDKSVDMVLTDPPYGTTACKWDSVIDFRLMWAELKRIVKNERSAVVLFGIEPFSSHLRLSNLEMFKYDWYWRKRQVSGFTNAKLKPLNDIELISVFSEGKTSNTNPKNMAYYPQGLVEINKVRNGDKEGQVSSHGYIRKGNKKLYTQTHTNYPRRVLEFNAESKHLHPTQKPVALLEYLIKTYTLEGETVLDFTMGSGSTGVACKNLNRKFIGIERDEKYFEIAKNRIENT